MMVMILRVALALMLSALAQAAHADSAPVPLKPDRPGLWRVMTYFDFTTKWVCPERQPTRPFCAIELIHACDARGDDELCERVWPHRRDPDFVKFRQGVPDGHLRYRIDKTRWITKADIERMRKHEREEPWSRTGDLLVTVRVLKCQKMDGGCPPERHARKHAYLLRRIDGLWQSMGWDSESYGYE